MPSTPLLTGVGQLPAFHVMTKPIGPICNLDCRYCFYLEKEDLYQSERKQRPSWEMPPEILESYIQQYIESQSVPEINFAWQGGEPTLLGVRFFERVVALQKKYANGKTIHNAFQTNGTLLDDAWGEFLSKNNFLIGLSVDGPAHLHDAYRVDKQGRPTFERVMAGMAVLKKHAVEFNTLTVVNRKNSQEPLAVYKFLREMGSGYIQFIPLVERNPIAPIETQDGLIQLSLATPAQPGQPRSPVTDWSVRSEDYGKFLIAIFDEWVRRDIGRTFVQMFDVALGNWAGAGPSLCVFSETCGAALALEHNGDLYACDHYVYPDYKLGNLKDTPLSELVNSETMRKFGNDKRDTLPKYCRECDVRFACHGECPKHRFLKAPDGEWGLNYLCAGYLKFFHHVDPYMKTMTRLLHAGRAPAELMAMILQKETAAATTKKAPGRNDPCPCGSGKKFKVCCLRH
ncbi:anaerobic sulfatase maturase [Armatimonas sp.]|uniref:anaerobic sulfatase maturase n=1 Tax=Armatimonas sp. TaxID=1872638 RepID=UPI00286AC52F|nr:anaerobic sulfatase maturase [Armatimonas sp.]